MKTPIFVVLLLIVGTAHCAFAQADEEKSFALSLGGSYMNFSGKDDFTKIYPSNVPALGAFVAIGNGCEFVLAEYIRFTASGTSIVTNATVKGKADWRQEVGGIGFRYIVPRSIWFFDIEYALMRVTEQITTVDPQIPQLTSSYSIQDRAIAVGLGLTPRLVGPIGLSVEGKYLFSIGNEKRNDGSTLPDLGGWFLSGGISLTFE